MSGNLQRSAPKVLDTKGSKADVLACCRTIRRIPLIGIRAYTRAKDRVKLPRPGIKILRVISNFLQYSLLVAMAYTNKKRKLVEDTRGDDFANQSHKRHYSNHAPLSSNSDRSAVQLKKSEAELISRSKQPAVADTATSSAEEASSSSVRRANAKSTDTSNTQPIQKATKQTKISGKAVGSSSDRAPAVKESDEDDEEKDEDDDATYSAEEQESEPENGTASDIDSAPSSESSRERASDAELDSDGEPHPNNNKKREPLKADNPNAFASSMAGILSYKLTKTQRANPILARSADAKEADETIQDMKLEKKAKAEMKREKLKKEGKDSQVAGDPVRDADGSLEVQGIFANQQREKELRKMAEKGVVKMFNAFNSVREKAAEAQILVGSRAKKEERATEMSKEGWLEYVGQGGKAKG